MDHIYFIKKKCCGSRTCYASTCTLTCIYTVTDMCTHTYTPDTLQKYHNTCISIVLYSASARGSYCICVQSTHTHKILTVRQKCLKYTSITMHVNDHSLYRSHKRRQKLTWSTDCPILWLRPLLLQEKKTRTTIVHLHSASLHGDVKVQGDHH